MESVTLTLEHYEEIRLEIEGLKGKIRTIQEEREDLQRVNDGLTIEYERVMKELEEEKFKNAQNYIAPEIQQEIEGAVDQLKKLVKKDYIK